jgi:ABC-2 type transport system permease protein
MSAPVLEPEPDLSGVPLAPPTIGNGLIGVFERRYLLRLLVKREISARYQGSVLGLLWSYVNPLTQFLIYWGLMSGLLRLHRDLENFGIHIFAGMVVVHFFIETFGAGTRSIVRNRTIVKKMAMPREMFPVATMLVSLFHVGPQVVILAIACLFYGWVPDPVGITAFLLAVIIISLLGTASALMFSAANVFFRDFGNVVNILNHLVRFGVPMIYPYSIVQERFGAAAQFYLFNPLSDAVLLMQRAFWTGTTRDPQATAASDLPDNLMLIGVAMLFVSVAVLGLSQVIFSKLENRIPERL